MRLWIKYLIASMSVTILTIGVAGVSFWGLQQLRESTDTLVEINHKIYTTANMFGKELAHSRRAEKEFFIFPDNPDKQLKYVVKWKKSYSKIRGYLNELDALFRITNNTSMLSVLDEASIMMHKNELEFAAVVDKFRETKSYDTVNKAEYGSFKKRTHKLEDISVQMSKFGLVSVGNNWIDLKVIQSNTQLRMMTISIVAILWGLLLPLFLAKRIVETLGYLTEISNKISLGNLDETIHLDRKDELGELAKAIQRMQRSLKNMLARQACQK